MLSLIGRMLMGIKPLPHFEKPLHIFTMQYKIKVQGNVETVVLLSQLKQKPDDYINVTIELDLVLEYK